MESWHVDRSSSNRQYALSCPGAMQSYWNKKKVLLKKRIELPRDGFATPNGRQFIVVEHQYGSMTSPWRTDARNVSFLNHFGG